MLELLNASFSLSNLLLTSLLGLILLYWASVIAGALDMKSIDVSMDKDIHFDKDLHIDKGIIVDKHIPIGKDIHTDKELVAESNFLVDFLRFFNFGQVPFMVVLSILVLIMWSVSVYCNNPQSFINPSQSVGLAFLLLVPNLFLSLFITKFLTAPLIPVFRKLDTTKAPLEYTGKTGILAMGMESDEIGQVKIRIEQAESVVRVRSADGRKLEKGEEVIIIDRLANGTYLVQKLDKL